MPNVTNYTEFRRFVVEPDLQDFMTNRDDVRKAWHCAGSLFHLADWVYGAHKTGIDTRFSFVNDQGVTRQVSRIEEFATALGQAYADFQLIRGIANSAKHFVLRPVPSGRVNPPGMPTHAANTYVSDGAFSTAFSNAFPVAEVRLQGPDIAFAGLAQSVSDMWDRLFTSEGW